LFVLGFGSFFTNAQKNPKKLNQTQNKKGTSDDDHQTVEGFCRRYVEPMGEESDHLHAQALVDALGVRVRVMYLDGGGGGGDGGGGGGGGGGSELGRVDFAPTDEQGGGGAAAGGGAPPVHILYRPGHYDILYPL
jgi:ubiquitin thioesterase protein OTUB1